MTDNELHAGGAEIANAVEEHDVLVTQIDHTEPQLPSGLHDEVMRPRIARQRNSPYLLPQSTITKRNLHELV